MVLAAEKSKTPDGACAFALRWKVAHMQEQWLGKKGLPSLVKKSGNLTEALDLPLRTVVLRL